MKSETKVNITQENENGRRTDITEAKGLRTNLFKYVVYYYYDNWDTDGRSRLFWHLETAKKSAKMWMDDKDSDVPFGGAINSSIHYEVKE